MIKQIFLFISILLVALSVQSQELSLLECQQMARANYPIAKQEGLIAETAKNTSSAISKQYYPQLQVSGQASYQSDVTHIDINLPTNFPSIDFPIPNKDQYKVYAEVSQLLYDGGNVSLQREAVAANALVDKQNLEVELYKLQEQINQLYFGILLAEEQLKQNEILQNDILTASEKMKVALANGVALESNLLTLEAELLNINQYQTEIHSNKESLLKTLGLLIGKELNENIIFKKPVLLTTVYKPRPEIGVIEYRLKSLDILSKQLIAKNMPSLGLFAQGGYGKPALNLFSNTFEPYYIGGIRLNWQFSRLYTLNKERSNIETQRAMLNIQRESFDLNTRISETQKNVEVQKIQKLLADDDAIISLRNEIKKASAVQLENGVITSTDFIREANAENQSRQKKTIHEMQLLMITYTLNWIKGQ